MKKRYQVFVSSTYEDLKEERSKVITALLNIGHIPCGMEYFPAADEDAWGCIERLIPQCDYYVVLVAGKYGSIAPSETKSYTHKEYELALKHGVPVLGLLHKEPSRLPHERCEGTPSVRKKLEQFRKLVERKLCRYWTSPEQIPGELLASLTQQIDRFPRTGWVRGDEVATDEAKTEIINLRRIIEKNEKSIEDLRKNDTAYENLFASGDEELRLMGCLSDRQNMWGVRGEEVNFMHELDFVFVSTWNKLLRFFALKEATKWDEMSLNKALTQAVVASIRDGKNFKSLRWIDIFVRWNDDELRKIEIQLNALGLATYRSGWWHLTNKGITQASRQLALRKGEVDIVSLNWFDLQKQPGKSIRKIPLTRRSLF